MPLKPEAAARKDQTSAAGYTRLEHRHFAIIAAIIGEMPTPARYDVAEHFARHLADTNPRFDRERFINACQVR